MPTNLTNFNLKLFTRYLIVIIALFIIIYINLLDQLLLTNSHNNFKNIRNSLSVNKSITETSLLNVTCGQSAYILGSNQKVISYTLYGNDPGYWRGLNTSLQTINKLYPDWYVRIYTDNPNSPYLQLLLKNYNYLQVCDVLHVPPPYNTLKDYPSMMWRFYALGDEQIDILLFRDTDSEILQREYDAVSEWLPSDKTVHVMRDHPQHSTAIMGGLWGIKFTPRNRFLWKQIRNEIFNRSYKSKIHKHLDQALLRSIVWPIFKNKTLAHDSYTCSRYPGSKPFPTERSNMTFVGAAYYRYYNRVLKEECPEYCRPKNHKNWIYC